MDYTILILALPLLSFLVLALAGMKMPHRVAGAIGTLSLGAVAVLSYLTAFSYFTAERTAEGTYPTLIPWNIDWLPFTQQLHIDMGIMLDPISVMMLIVISTVSLMVHIYSFGYMKGEKGFQRYYAFLSLFTFSMLGLVVATNIFQMYVFWELVGVSSYLLIGFYYTKPEAILASKKAFIVTRFADLGFLIGILIYGYYMQTFTFTPSEEQLMKAGMVLPWAECHVPVAYLVAGCHGRSYTGICPHPRRYHGCSRSVSGSPHVPALYRICSKCTALGSLHRCFHRLLCRLGSLCTERHQACTRLLHHLTDRIYDGSFRCMYFHEPARRWSGLHGRYVPPVHSRHVQGTSSMPYTATKWKPWEVCTNTCLLRTSPS